MKKSLPHLKQKGASSLIRVVPRHHWHVVLLIASASRSLSQALFVIAIIPGPAPRVINGGGSHFERGEGTSSVNLVYLIVLGQHEF